MTVQDPRKKSLNSVDLTRCHVNYSPPIVFLFGGPTGASPPNSVRGHLYDYLNVKKPAVFDCLVMPENFPDWLHDSVYPDLLTFEEDLAQISTLVIIALESPGSIAELGAFSVNNGLKNKILIFLSEHHHSQESFITLGPLRQLDDQNVYAFPYQHNNIAATLTPHLPAIADAIELAINDSKKTRQFDPQSDGHVALLIYELARLFHALTLSEIREFLDAMDASRNRTVTKRLLFLLLKLDLIGKRRYLNVDYYFAKKIDQRVQFTVQKGAPPFDSLAVSLGASQYYGGTDKEKNRHRLIALIGSGGPQ